MNSFRWLLGIITTTLLGGWILLVVVGGSFRRSFGASPTSLLVDLLPGLLFVMILATLAWPGQRGLLHATAIGALAGLGVAIWILRESPTTGLLALGYLGCWLAYYWVTTRASLVNG